MPRRKTKVLKQTETAKNSCLKNNGCGASSEEGDGGGGGVRSGLSVGAASERSFGAMSGGVAHVGVHAEDSGLLSEASFGALSCGGVSFGRSEGGAGDSEGEGEGEVECERSFGALSGGVRSERSGALSEVSFGGGGSVAGVSYARSEGCGASSEEGDGGGGGVRSGLSVGAAVRRPPRWGYGFFVLFIHEPHRHRYGLGWSR